MCCHNSTVALPQLALSEKHRDGQESAKKFQHDVMERQSVNIALCGGDFAAVRFVRLRSGLRESSTRQIKCHSRWLV